jgi:hypothetical protein
MKSDFILNVDISTSKKFSSEEFEFFKEEIENNFPFNEFSLILIENSELTRAGSIEIYIEDLEMEFDLTEEIESIIYDTDILVSGIFKGSRIEWYSSRDICNHVWTKESGTWKKSEEDGNSDFYEDSFFGFEE